MKHHGDITLIHDAPMVDAIFGGSPCQNLSVAGNGKGLAGEQSKLFYEQIRVIKEMRNSVRTDDIRRVRFSIWENVEGAFHSNKGKDFASVLTEFSRIIDPKAPDVPVPPKGWPHAGALLVGCGSIAWRLHDARWWGVPQRRKRICVLCDFDGDRAPFILFGAGEHIGDAEKTDQDTADRYHRAVEREAGEVSPLGEGVSWHHPQSEQAREEDAAAPYGRAGRDDTVGFFPHKDGAAYATEIVAMDRAGCAGCGKSSLGREYLCGTIATSNDQTLFAPVSVENHPQDSRITIIEDGTVQTLSGRMGTGGGNTPIVLQKTRRYIARRLTPKECERLQGFPDDWTDIGEYTDTKGKRRKTSDSARYTAIGNSIAIPFWRELIKGIRTEGAYTMASLFDGIGGFPLLWTESGGKAVWASEIEEFCIAVTKERFGDE